MKLLYSINVPFEVCRGTELYFDLHIILIFRVSASNLPLHRVELSLDAEPDCFPTVLVRLASLVELVRQLVRLAVVLLGVGRHHAALHAVAVLHGVVPAPQLGEHHQLAGRRRQAQLTGLAA